MDGPIVSLVTTSVMMDAPEEALRPEDRRAEQSLKKAHQSAAWAAKASISASFFNQASLLWLRQLQDKIPMVDVRVHQDLNKLSAALEFSADATLGAVMFASKAIASSTASRRLLLLRHWQADAKQKWWLASTPFSGTHLFGESLEWLLVETKEKCKILPSLSRRADPCLSPYFPHTSQSFRGPDGGVGLAKPQHPFHPRQDQQQDRAVIRPVISA